MHRSWTLLLFGNNRRNPSSSGERTWRKRTGRTIVQPFTSCSGCWSEGQRRWGSQQQRVWTGLPGRGCWTYRRIVSCSMQNCLFVHWSKQKKCCQVFKQKIFLNQLFPRDYPMMLSVFSNLLAKETDLSVIDNLCGALCRMITGNIDAVPLEQVSSCCIFTFKFCVLLNERKPNNVKFNRKY